MELVMNEQVIWISLEKASYLKLLNSEFRLANGIDRSNVDTKSKMATHYSG